MIRREFLPKNKLFTHGPGIKLLELDFKDIFVNTYMQSFVKSDLSTRNLTDKQSASAN